MAHGWRHVGANHHCTYLKAELYFRAYSMDRAAAETPKLQTVTGLITGADKHLNPTKIVELH